MVRFQRENAAVKSNDSKEIFQLASFLIHQHWHGEPVSQIQVTALDPSEEGVQLDIFNRIDTKRELLYKTLDEINDRYGEFAIAPAPMLFRSEMPNVIAPAWETWRWPSSNYLMGVDGVGWIRRASRLKA